MTLSAYVVRWLDDPDGGGTFTRQRDLIRAHPPECSSLAHPWLPRKGGVSCITDTISCQGCGTDFFWEGMHAPERDCPYSDHFYCQCCLTEECECPAIRMVAPANHDTERCTSCEHEMCYHDVDGRCWFTVEQGTPGHDLVCACLRRVGEDTDLTEGDLDAMMTEAEPVELVRLDAAPPKPEQCLNCEHYHTSTCMVPVTLDSGTLPCGCDWHESEGIHRFVLEFDGPPIPETRTPAMTREQAFELIHNALRERFKHSHFTISLDGTPSN